MATEADGGNRRFGTRARWAIAIGILLGLLSIAGAGIAYAGLSYSHHYQGRIFPGSTIDGTRVGGLTRNEAVRKVRAQVKPALTREITVRWHGKTWSVTPKQLGAKSNAKAAVDAALAASAQLSFSDKVQMRLFHRGLGFHRGVAITYPKQGVRGFVHGISSGFDRSAVDASLDYSTGWVKVTPDHTGRRVQQGVMRQRILRALRHDQGVVKLASKSVQPAVTTDAFKQVLLVRIGENKAYLYENGKITHSYTVATGQPQYPTPQGLFQIVSKIANPTWINPAPNGWAAGMPASIPPGPDNPMGLHELNWSAAGVAFHGVPDGELSSLGFNASHGCIRMSNPDATQLYGLVDVGTPVVSIQVAPYRTMG
ncbi:MAG TPA: L,D-transpeptidase family protein [Actinomycetota bacterium]|jgi:lipoprotein-anchoring transpeptidase ErfK/SrfK|nr:L,D-transpeptidase family protein [Actinomycetota bacterium]